MATSNILNTRLVLRNDIAEAWLQANPVLLPGEIGIETDSGLFKIGNGSSTWTELSYANSNEVFVDNKTIVFEEESGALALHNWGKKYYKWNKESNSFVETEGWANNLEPRVDERGELSWYESGAVVYELQDQIAALDQKFNGYLPLEGGTLSGALTLEDGYKAISEQEAEVKIASAIESAGHLKREIVAALPSVESANPNTIYMVKDEDGYIEWMLINGVFEQIGDTTIDLTPYIQKVDGAIANNLVIFSEDGALLDSGIAAQKLTNHLDNNELHITTEERNEWNKGLILATDNTNALAALRTSVETKKFEVTNVPKGAKVSYKDNEIRVMAPHDTIWEKQAVGATGNPNMYYMTFKAYAPENAYSFKEGDRGVVIDEMFTFDHSAAGIDEFGRKYSVCWFALASYSAETDTWTYFGASSTTKKYLGWDYVVEWYDENGNIISNDKIRVNLSNENCHEYMLPYYMGSVVKNIELNGSLLDVIDNTVKFSTNTIINNSNEIVVDEEQNNLRLNAVSVSKLFVPEDEELILNGGSSAL